MATEQPIVDSLLTYIANSDLRTNQYHIVRIVCWSDDWNQALVDLCGDGLKPCGILQNDPNISQPATVMTAGKSKCVTAQELNCAQSWASNAVGHARGAMGGDWVGGQAHEPGVLAATPTGGEIMTLLVECYNPWRADAQFVDA